MSANSKSAIRITPDHVGQRLDNFLFTHLKGVPKTRIYKAIRSGEVRINGGRCRVSARLQLHDQIRIPPLRTASREAVIIPPRLADNIPTLYEDDYLWIVNKPAGLAVHGGSGMDFGIIEALRQLRPESGFLELVHRLDRETSGCLMLAKSRSVLLAMQQQFMNNTPESPLQKTYCALLTGVIEKHRIHVDTPIAKLRNRQNCKTISAVGGGQHAESLITVERRFADYTHVRIRLFTGRTHQARIHCAHLGFAIAGDRLYGDRESNLRLRKLGLGRLFLHASKLQFSHPILARPQHVAVPLPLALQRVLENLA